MSGHVIKLHPAVVNMMDGDFDLLVEVKLR